MNTVYFIPPHIKPGFCEVGTILESDEGYIYYLTEPCKIPISEVEIVPAERVEYDKKLKVFRVKNQDK